MAQYSFLAHQAAAEETSIFDKGSSKFTVCMKVRPMSCQGKNSHQTSCLYVNKQKIDILNHESKDDLPPKSFTFDSVFDGSSSQADFYDAKCKHLVSAALDGSNAAILAYGPSTSGKTFTMTGMNSDQFQPSDGVAGVIPRAFEHIFEHIKHDDQNDYSVHVSYLEIYNETLIDLFAPMSDQDISEGDTQALVIEPCELGDDVRVKGLREKEVFTMDEVHDCLDRGQQSISSRISENHTPKAYFVFQCTIEKRSKTNVEKMSDKKLRGKLQFVEFPGCEKIGKTNANEERLREAQCIGKSIGAFFDVMNVLTASQSKKGVCKHIPYRNSKITLLLRQCLHRCLSNVLLVIHLLPCNYQESINCLRTGVRLQTKDDQPPPPKAAIEEVNADITPQHTESDGSETTSTS